MTDMRDTTSTKKTDLANHVIQICHKFYTDSNNLLRDFPGDDLSNFYEVYENKIESLKIELKFNGLLTDRVDKGLNRIVSNIKLGENKHYEAHLNKLIEDLNKSA